MSETAVKSPFVMSEEAYNEILKAFMDRMVTMPCSRCGRTQFELQPFYTPMPVVPDYNMPSSYGPFIPCAVVVCSHCGNVSLHSLAQLGLKKEPQPAPSPAP